MTEIRLKRVYDEFDESDGYRILIDRLWPRGIKKESLKLDLWDKDIAPSTELRKWFQSDQSGNWNEFVVRYIAELRATNALPELVENIRGKKTITLLYGAKDPEHNQAVVLKDELKKRVDPV